MSTLTAALLAAVTLASPLAPVPGAAPAARAADDAAGLEYSVKAACLYRFVPFVEWPADAFDGPDSPLVISVVGRNPFGDALERAVGGKRVNGRRLEVRYAGRPDQIGPACHVLFLPDAERDRLGDVLRQVRGRSVLTVGETDGFAQNGGVIRFYQADGKVRFEISQKAAHAARLKISSQLLKLARVVES